VSSYDIITELVTLDIDGQRLTEVEPKVEFLSTVELENSAAANDDTGDPSNDSSNAASQQAD
jgi:hypothetical protein